MIYADNAATTKLNIDAYEAMKPFLLENYGNASQPYAFSRSSRKALIDSRKIIAECIGASPDEIFFTSGGTESDNWAIKGIVQCENKGIIITSKIEHHAVLNACHSVERLGYPVIYLPVDSFGVIEPTTLIDFITNNTKLVSVMLANNEIGTIEPIRELCEIAHEHGALFHTDAVQAVGHIPLDVKELNVDMFSASAHKFNGPKGIGFLYIRKGTSIFPLNDGGFQEQGLRAGTENIASIVGMAVALKANCLLIDSHMHYLNTLEKRFLDILKSENVDFIRNGTNYLPGNVSLSFPKVEGEVLLHRLDLKGICISTGSACDSKNTKISHVIEAIDVPADYKYGTIRVSFGINNTVEDVDTIANNLVSILSTL